MLAIIFWWSLPNAYKMVTVLLEQIWLKNMQTITVWVQNTWKNEKRNYDLAYEMEMVRMLWLNINFMLLLLMHFFSFLFQILLELMEY